MFRKNDWIGVVGVGMLIMGAFLFLRNADGVLPLWAAWLLGPLLWYGGFLTTSLWFLTRIYTTQKRAAQRKGAESSTEPSRKASNFLEHDGEVVGQAVMAHKSSLYCAGLVSLALFFVPAMGASAWADDAAALFKAKCAPCHGANADGKTPMGTKLNIHDFRSPEVQKQTDKEITDTIAKGKNKMPAYEGKLTPEQIGQLTNYVREAGKKN